MEAKQQKAKSSRAPKVQQSFKDIIKDGEMEIEQAAKRHSGQAKRNADVDIDELDQMMEDLNLEQKTQMSTNKTIRNVNVKREAQPTAQIGIKSDLPLSLKTLDKQDCLFKLHGFDSHFKENKRIMMLDFNPKQIPIQD